MYGTLIRPIWEIFRNIWAFFEKALSFLDVLKIHHMFLQLSLCSVVYPRWQILYLRYTWSKKNSRMDVPRWTAFHPLLPSFCFKTSWEVSKKKSWARWFKVTYLYPLVQGHQQPLTIPKRFRRIARGWLALEKPNVSVVCTYLLNCVTSIFV